MCLALPGKVLEVVDSEAGLARVDVLGASRTVNLSLVGDVAAGDWVLVYAGLAMERIGQTEAEETLRLFREITAASEDDATCMNSPSR